MGDARPFGKKEEKGPGPGREVVAAERRHWRPGPDATMEWALDPDLTGQVIRGGQWL